MLNRMMCLVKGWIVWYGKNRLDGGRKF